MTRPFRMICVARQRFRWIAAFGLFAAVLAPDAGCVVINNDHGADIFRYKVPQKVGETAGAARGQTPVEFLGRFMVASSRGPRIVYIHRIYTFLVFPPFPMPSGMHWLISGSKRRLFFVFPRLIFRPASQHLALVTAAARALRGNARPYYSIAISPFIVGIPLRGEFPQPIPARRIHFFFWGNSLCMVPAKYADALFFKKILVLRRWPGNRVIQASKRHYLSRHLNFRKFIETHTTVIHLPKPTSAINLMKTQPWKKMGLKFHYP